jgi:sugar lactone lactonase YvrE
VTAVRCAVETRDILGETPLWSPRDRSVWWLDIDGRCVHRYKPATAQHTVHGFDAGYVGSLALAQDGRLLVGLDLALHAFDPSTGTLDLVAQVEPRERDNRLNDGRCDARGRFWVGTMDNQLTRPNGAFYRVDPDGSVTRWFGDVIVSNTVALSPDQRTLYFSDTRRYTTWAFDLDADRGTIGNRRVFVDYTATGERPDGACVDAEDCIWTAMFAGGRVVRYTPDARVERVIRLPVTNPTCVCLGGDDLRTLYITTARKFLSERELCDEPLAGALLAVDVDVPGLPEATFGR